MSAVKQKEENCLKDARRPEANAFFPANRPTSILFTV